MRVASILKAMGHPTRLQILQRIAQGEYCVSDLERELAQSQPNISQHLAKLRDCGLIIPERRGGMTCYKLADRRVADLIHQARDMLGLTARKETVA